jgi:hypothetical protein
VYVVVVVGDAVTLFPLALLKLDTGDQVNVRLGLDGTAVALNAIDCPLQMVSFNDLTITGYGRIFIVRVSVTVPPHTLPLILMINVSSPSTMPSCKAVTVIVVDVALAGIIAEPLSAVKSSPLVAVPDIE